MRYDEHEPRRAHLMPEAFRGKTPRQIWAEAQQRWDHLSPMEQALLLWVEELDAQRGQYA